MGTSVGMAGGSSRPGSGTVESGALPEGEDAPLVQAALADSVGDADVSQASLGYTASDLGYG